jgi:hypothetical protein
MFGRPWRFRPGRCPGAALLPAGLPALEGAVLPAWGSIRPGGGPVEGSGQ